MRIDSLTPDLSNNRLYYGQISADTDAFAMAEFADADADAI